MASALLSSLQNLWPFSIWKEDDLRTSARLVGKLSIPERTKQFVFAFRDPNSHAVIYILAAQNLSEQSAIDVDCLIKEVHPKAVVAQVPPAASADMQTEERCLAENQTNIVPASPFQVLKRCITDKINKDQYVQIAACQVLQEIFGAGFYGHFLAAKRAAEQTGSCFLLLESPYERNYDVSGSDSAGSTDKTTGLQLHTSWLIPASATSVVSSRVKKIFLADAGQGQILKSLTSSLNNLMSQANSSESVAVGEPAGCQPANRYEAPPFAQSVYPLLADLYDMFADIPLIGRAMASAQKMLARIQGGEPISSEMLSDVYIFRIAIEGLRIGLNNAARRRIDARNDSGSSKVEFSDLPSEEKCHVLLVQALRSQVREPGSVVAIVDASCLAGIRRHWNTSVPPEIEHLAGSSFRHYGEDDSDTDVQSLVENIDKRRIAEKHVIAVGAGATAILGASSLSKAVHASSFFKLAVYKTPLVLKYGLMQLQRNAAIGLSKILVPSKLPGIASFGSKTSTLQFTASAEKIRAVTHTVISSAERTSLMAMRTAFYEIMQKRSKQPFRVTPWATFACSMAACGGLLMHGDGIECAAEAVPSVPMIASLGRGLEGLRLTSHEVSQTSGQKVNETLQTLMSNLTKSTK